MPRRSVRLLDLDLRASILERDVGAEWDIAVLQIFTGNVLFVDTVLVTVNPVVPDDVVL